MTSGQLNIIRIPSFKRIRFSPFSQLKIVLTYVRTMCIVEYILIYSTMFSVITTSSSLFRYWKIQETIFLLRFNQKELSMQLLCRLCDVTSLVCWNACLIKHSMNFLLFFFLSFFEYDVLNPHFTFFCSSAACCTGYRKSNRQTVVLWKFSCLQMYHTRPAIDGLLVKRIMSSDHLGNTLSNAVLVQVVQQSELKFDVCLELISMKLFLSASCAQMTLVDGRNLATTAKNSCQSH